MRDAGRRQAFLWPQILTCRVMLLADGEGVNTLSTSVNRKIKYVTLGRSTHSHQKDEVISDTRMSVNPPPPKKKNECQSLMRKKGK